MELNLNTVLIAVLGLATGIAGWVFKYILSNIDKKIEALQQKDNQLEARQYEFENDKYNALMEVLSGIKADIAVLKSEISNLKGKG